MKRLLLFAAVAFFLPVAAGAATVSLRIGSGTHAVLEPVPIAVYLDTDGESVNAANVVIGFNAASGSASAPSNAGSKFNVWVTAPRVAGETVRFEGAATVPFTGSGKVGEFVITPTREGKLILSVSSETVAYKADGLGTPLVVSPHTAVIDVGAAPVALPAPVIAPADLTPPEDVILDVGKDADGGWVAAFTASDKDSGYDRAEISIDGGTFRPAQSPYRLGKTSPGIVTLRVYDRAGNARDITKNLRTGFHMSLPAALAAVIVVVLLLILIARRLVRRKRRT
jgi:hypothetical protein